MNLELGHLAFCSNKFVKTDSSTPPSIWRNLKEHSSGIRTDRHQDKKNHVLCWAREHVLQKCTHSLLIKILAIVMPAGKQSSTTLARSYFSCHDGLNSMARHNAGCNYCPITVIHQLVNVFKSTITACFIFLDRSNDYKIEIILLSVQFDKSSLDFRISRHNPQRDLGALKFCTIFI